MSVSQRRGMVNKDNPLLSLSRQCDLLALNRSTFYYKPRSDDKGWDAAIKEEIEQIMTELPYYGSRKVSVDLKGKGILVGRRRATRLLREMGLRATQPRKFKACKRQESRVYPYLLGNLVITQPNQVWGTDISYIPTRYGWTYLMAIMDLHSRMILGWKLSSTLEVAPCVQLLKETVAKYGKPGIMNQDQGSQYTSREWTETVEGYGIRMSMAGKGRCYDNIHVERGWRSLKQEEVYLNDYVTLKDARESIGLYIEQYNHVRRHQGLGYQTPASVYANANPWKTRRPRHQEQLFCV